MDPSHLDAFLSALERREPDNWEWERFSGNNCWWVKYTGCLPPCQFHIEVGPVFVYLHVALGIHIWAECRLAVYRYALRLNEEISGAKFGLSHDGQLALMVGWPRDSLTFASLETAIKMLLTYYETYYPDIQQVAQDVALASHIATRELQELATEEAIQIQVTAVHDE